MSSWNDSLIGMRPATIDSAATSPFASPLRPAAACTPSRHHQRQQQQQQPASPLQPSESSALRHSSPAVSHDMEFSACHNSATHTDDVSPFSNGFLLSEDGTLGEGMSATTMITTAGQSLVQFVPSSSTTATAATTAAAPTAAMMMAASGGAVSNSRATGALVAVPSDWSATAARSTTTTTTTNTTAAAAALNKSRSDRPNISVLHTAVAPVSDSQPLCVENTHCFVDAAYACMSPLLCETVTAPEGTALATPIYAAAAPELEKSGPLHVPSVATASAASSAPTTTAGMGKYAEDVDDICVHWCCPAHWRAIGRMERAVQAPVSGVSAAVDVYCVPTLAAHEGTADVPNNTPLHVGTLPQFIAVPPAALTARAGSERQPGLEEAEAWGPNTANQPVCEYCGRPAEPMARAAAAVASAPRRTSQRASTAPLSQQSRVSVRAAAAATAAAGVVSATPALAQPHRRSSLRQALLHGGVGPSKRSAHSSSSHTAATTVSNMTSASYKMPLSSSSESSSMSLGCGEEWPGMDVVMSLELRETALLAVADML